MFPYYFLFALVSLLAFVFTIKESKENIYIFLYLSLIIGFFGGFRSLNTGFDNWAYLDYYNDHHILSFSDGFPFLVDNMEIGYYLFNIILRTFHLHQQFILLLPSIFCVLSFAYLVTRIKNNYNFVLVAYLSFVLVHNNFSIVRQSIAVGFTYIALAFFIENKSRVKILVLLCLACFFHASSVVYFFLYVFSKSFYKYIYSMRYVGLTIFFVSFFKYDFALELTNGLIQIDAFSVLAKKYYDYNLIVYTPGLNFTIYLIFNLVLLFMCTSRISFSFINKNLLSLVVYSTVFLMFAMVLSPSNYILWGRISIVTLILQSFFISIYVSRLKILFKLTYSSIFYFVYFIFFLYNMISYSYGLDPYVSVFSE